MARKFNDSRAFRSLSVFVHVSARGGNSEATAAGAATVVMAYQILGIINVTLISY